MSLPFLKKKYKKPIGTEEFSFSNSINKKIRKIAIFACFSPNGEISNLQKYYLNELNKNFDGVIMIYDSYIKKEAFESIKNKVIYFEAKRHNEYDFGSYKIGYSFLKKTFNLNSIESLALLNDSVYGPIYSLDEIIEKMKQYDFWGMSSNKTYQLHLQSWFLYFNKKVLESDVLYGFLSNVKVHKFQQSYVKNYETKLTSYLSDKGFSFNSYLPQSFQKKKFMTRGDQMFFMPEIIEQYHFPFIKKKSFDSYFYHIVDNRKLAINTIQKINSNLYKLIIEDLKSRNYDMSFLD